MRSIIYLISLWILFAVASPLLAGDTNLISVFGAKTFARNGLYFAGQDGLAAISANPAALTLPQGWGIEGTVMDRAGRQETMFNNRSLHRSFRDNDLNFAAGVYWAISPRLTAALAYYPASDYEVEWPYAVLREKPGSSVVLVFDMFNRLQADALTPAIGLKLGKVKVGLAANIYRVSQHTAFPQANELWFSGTGLSAYQFEFEQDGWAVGGNLGMMANISDRLRIGAVVRSAYKASLDGTATSQMFVDLDSGQSTVNLSSDFEMPWVLGAGAVYKLNATTEFNIDASYSLWGSTQESYDFGFSSLVWETGLVMADTVTGISGGTFALQYENALDLGIGFEYAPPQGLTYRFGYRFSKSPNSEMTYNLLFPGVDQHWFSGGIGYRSKNFTLDIALAYAMGVAREITSSENPNAFGTYDSNTIVPVANLKYKF